MNETTPESQGVSVEEKAGRDCDRCRVAAAAGAPFVTEINAFGRRRTFCPSCLSARQRRYGFLFIGWNAAGLAVGCSILAFTSLDPLGWTLVNLSLLQIFQLFDTLIHEFGHAFSGRVMGLAVEGVEIGLGPLVWSGRILGYRVKLRSVPLGGLTLLQSKIIRWPRIRWGMMVVAGPLANALLAVSAWAWIHNSGGSFGFLSVPTSLAALLFWSNAVSATVSLFPTMVITSHGRIPNDGLMLIRLVLGISTTSEEMEPPSNSSESPSRRVRFVVQLIVWIAGVVCMGIALLLFLIPNDSARQPVSMVVGFLFAALGLTLFWLGVRAGKPWRLSTSGRGIGTTGYNLAFHRQFSREVLAARSALAPQMLASVDAALQAKDWSRVLAESERLSVDQHRISAFILQGSEALLELNRHHEAAAEAERALGQPGLGWALRTSASLVRLRALLRDRQLESVNAAADEWCSSDIPLPGKLVLLDAIACEILYGECRDQLPAAESWARKAVALCPLELSIKGTLGAILVELGRHDEAEPLLRETYEQSPSPNDQRICAFYLALVAKRRKQTSRIHAFVTEAKEAADQPWLIAKLEQEFPDLSDCGNQIH